MKLSLRTFAAFATSFVFFAAGTELQAQTTTPIVWTNLSGATATGNTVQKTAGCGGCPDAGATSTQTLTKDGYVEFRAVPGARLYAGLGSTTTANTEAARIDFAFSFWPDGGWDVRERNMYRTEGRFVGGDLFRVALVAGKVKYYQNGLLVYASDAIPTFPLVLDTTLIDAGATVSGAIITTTATSAPVSIVTTSLPAGAVGQAYSYALQAAGGSGSYRWSLAGGTLPAGLSLSVSGVLSGSPLANGTSLFTVRATDAANPASYADRFLAASVPVIWNAITIQTTTLPAARVTQPYSTTLTATGGTPPLRWTINAGALPAGLTLDSSTAVIKGTPSASGTFRFTVRASDRLVPTNFNDRVLDLSVAAGDPPPSGSPSGYNAITDRTTRVKPALPALGGAGFGFADPEFGSRIVRVTDGAVRPGSLNRSYRTPSSTHANAWSADGRFFYTVSTDGTVVPFSFDPATMRAARLQASSAGDGGLTLRFFNEPTFSYLSPGVAYGTYSGAGSNLRSIDQYDFATGVYSPLLNLDTLVPNLAGTYTGGLGASAGAVERLFAFFGGTGQDRHYYVVVFDRNNPARRHLLDTAASTIDGLPTSTPLNFRIHAANIDRSGRYMTIYPTGPDLQAPRSAAPVYLWDIESGTFTALPLVDARTGGHDAFGYGDRVNQDCCTSSSWDAAQWQYRSLATPMTTFDLIRPVLLPQEVYLADHPSWHNARPDRLMPFIDANYRYGTSVTPWRAWDEEIIAVQTDGAGGGGLVWRFAHHRSAVADDLDPSRISFWYTPRVNVSPDGRWALFTSNWEKTLGIDPGGDPGASRRQDVFLIELK